MMKGKMREELLGEGKQQSKHMLSAGGGEIDTIVLGQKTRRRLTCTVATTINTTRLLSAHLSVQHSFLFISHIHFH